MRANTIFKDLITSILENGRIEIMTSLLWLMASVFLTSLIRYPTRNPDCNWHPSSKTQRNFWIRNLGNVLTTLKNCIVLAIALECWCTDRSGAFHWSEFRLAYVAPESNLKTQKSLIQNHQKFKRQSWPSLIIFSCSDIQSTTWKTMPSALARLCPRCPLSKIMSRQILSANGGRLLMNNLLILNATLRVCQIDHQIQENFHTSSIDDSYHVTHTTGYLKKNKLR